MEYLNRHLHGFDRLQQNHRILGFPIAVIKKYGDDKGGYKAALLTYYGFLSLFPAILVTITLVRWLLQNDSQLKQRVITSITNYFPLIGPDLQQNLHGFSKTGLPFLAGMAVLVYGIRGAAEVYRYTVNDIWHTPKRNQSNFWSSLGKSFIIILIATIGFFVSAILTGYATAARHHGWLRALFLLASMVVISSGFVLATRVALNRKARKRELWVGAGTTAVGLIVLQTAGKYLLSHELKNLNNLYGAFAAVLGLLFLIYVQAQIIVYSMEISSVWALKKWPRQLFGEDSN